MKLPVHSILIIILLFSCNENDSQTKTARDETFTPIKKPVQLSYYRCDYAKQQYDTVLCSGDEHINTEVWGLNKSDVGTLPNIQEQAIDTTIIVNMAAAHLRKRFPDIAILSSDVQIERINERDTSDPMNWFIDVSFLYDKKGYYQKVPILLDGRIILSSNE